MSIRNVLKIYALERELAPDDVALLETLRRATEADRAAFVETLTPPPTTKRKAAARKSASKSPRAASLAGAIAGTAKPAITLCAATLESSGADCGLPEGHALHVDKGYVDHHPFQPAPPAVRQSSAKSEATSTTPSSATEQDDAGDVAHAASGGD